MACSCVTHICVKHIYVPVPHDNLHLVKGLPEHVLLPLLLTCPAWPALLRHAVPDSKPECSQVYHTRLSAECHWNKLCSLKC